MEYGIKLTIDGEERNVLHFFTEYFRLNSSDPILMSSFPTLDECNRNLPYYRFDPSGPPLDGRFRVTMESTDDDDLFYANLKTGRFMHGIFRFYRTLDEGIPFRTIEFWDTFVSETCEQMSSDGMPMLLHVVLSPATVRFNKGLVFQKNWFVTDINKKAETFERTEPQILRICWTDEQNERRELSELEEGQEVTLCVEVEEGGAGTTVDVVIEADDDRIFEDGSTRKKYSGLPVENDNTAYIDKFSIKYKGKE